MKLIDTDRLLTDRMKSKYYHLPNGDTAVPIIDIENAPTVNAIPIPDNATNGDMITAMFPNVEASVFVKEVGVKGLDTYSTFTKKWWNSPYEGGKEE